MKKISIGIFALVVLSGACYFLIASWANDSKVKGSGSGTQKEGFNQASAAGSSQSSENPALTKATEPELPDWDYSTPVSRQEIKNIRRVNFSDCSKAKNSEEFSLCLMRMDVEFGRVSRVRDSGLVSDLIKLAEQKRFKVLPLYTMQNEMETMLYRQKICQLRYGAIRALGEIKDPRAIEPLLAIMEEKFTEETGCFFDWGDGPNSICSEAAQALVKLQSQGISARLLKDLEGTWSSYEKADKDLNSAGSKSQPREQSLFQLYSLMSDYSAPECYLDVLSQLGDEGRQVIFDKLKSNNLSEAETKHYWEAAARAKLTSKEIDFLTKLIFDEYEVANKWKKDAAVQILVQNPTLNNTELYRKLIDHGYVIPGIKALAKIKAPEGIPYLFDILNGQDDKMSAVAAEELINYDDKDIKPIVPILIVKIIKTDDRAYYRALAKAQDPSAVKPCYEMVYAGADGNVNALATIGLIICPESQITLRKIIQDNEDYINKGFQDDNHLLSFRKRALFWLFYQVEEEGVNYGLQYFSNKTVIDELHNGKALKEHDSLDDILQNKIYL